MEDWIFLISFFLLLVLISLVSERSGAPLFESSSCDSCSPCAPKACGASTAGAISSDIQSMLSDSFFAERQLDAGAGEEDPFVDLTAFMNLHRS